MIGGILARFKLSGRACQLDYRYGTLTPKAPDTQSGEVPNTGESDGSEATDHVR